MVTIYLTDDVFSVKAKRFNIKFTSILALFVSPKIQNKLIVFSRIKSFCKSHEKIKSRSAVKNVVLHF